MSWKQWTAVVLVIGVGIVWQIPHREGAVEERGRGGDTAAPAVESDAAKSAVAAENDVAAESDVAAGPYRTIALEVTGMT